MILKFTNAYSCQRSHLQVIPNQDGRLCSHYPPEIIIPTEASSTSESAATSRATGPAIDTVLASQMADARFARTRSRFVCPVIRHRGKVFHRHCAFSISVDVSEMILPQILQLSM